MSSFVRKLALAGLVAGCTPSYEATSPERLLLADLTVVVTGGSGRVQEALTAFSRSCRETKGFLLISGISSPPQAVMDAADVDVPEQCYDRLIFESHALTTSGNARAVTEVIEELSEKNHPIRSLNLVSSWYHLERLQYYVDWQLAHSHNNITSVYATAVGNCHSLSCGVRMVAREQAGLWAARVGYENSQSWDPNGQITIGFTPSPH